MQYFKRLSVVVLGMYGLTFSQAVYALGTNADDDVTNAVSMTYTVNSVTQTALADVTFKVDRKLQVEVNTTQTNWVTAIPGQTFASGNYSSIQFTVANLSNDEVGMRLALIDQGQLAISGGDPWDAPSAELSAALITIWEDTNGNGSYDAGTDDLLGNSLGILPVLSDFTFSEDETRDYYVSVDVAGTDVADLFETYTLVAAVADNATGTNVLQTDDSGNSTHGVADPAVNPNGITTLELVFADFVATVTVEDIGYDYVGDSPSAAADDSYDGQASDSSGFRTRIALGIAKFVEVLYDPISGNRYVAGVATNDPKAIPGAVLLYVIGISADSGVAATSVAIDDDIPGAFVTPGNLNAVVGIEIPATVNITINGGSVAFGMAAGVAANDQYHTQDCAGSALLSTDFFPLTVPEVDGALLGSCTVGQTGYVAYVVTVTDT